MKYRSETHKNAFFEKWETPLSRASQISLLSLLQTIHTVYLFFQLNNITDKIHVISFPRNSPYRVTKEQPPYIRQYYKGSSRRKASNTWKLWGTKFISDLEAIGADLASYYREKPNKPIFEYLIVTADENIEFIWPRPRWKTHCNANIETLIQYYLKKPKKIK